MNDCISKWTLKIHTTIGGCVVVGITSNFNINSPFQWDNNQTNYAYLGDSGDVGHKGNWKQYDLQHSRRRAFSNNDVVEIILDLNKRTISFTKNNVDLGIAYKDIPKSVDISFKLVISVRNHGDGATIMDFQQSFPKR